MRGIALIGVDNLDQALEIARSWPVGGYIENPAAGIPGERLFANVRSGPAAG